MVQVLGIFCRERNWPSLMSSNWYARYFPRHSSFATWRLRLFPTWNEKPLMGRIIVLWWGTSPTPTLGRDDFSCRSPKQVAVICFDTSNMYQAFAFFVQTSSCSYIANICSRHWFFYDPLEMKVSDIPDHGRGRSGPIYLKSWPLVITLYFYIYLYLSEIDPILSQSPRTNFLCLEIDVDVSGSFVFCHFCHFCHF